MRKHIQLLIILCSLFLLVVSCTTQEQGNTDLINDTFPEVQAELKKVLDDLYNDAMTSNLEGVAASHLMTPKFTKFGGQSFERLTVEETNKSEAEALSAIKELNVELTDLKIDVFGKVAVTTYYSHFSYIYDGQLMESLARQALIFLETENGWKIIHENVTPEKCFSE